MSEKPLELQSPSDKYLLYIDILGFRQLVEQGQDQEVRSILAQVAGMHVHKDRYFPVIMFSDTILIYNGWRCNGIEQHSQAVSFLCEFSQDLFQRLVPINTHFRAIIKRGSFNHEEINGKEFFFGKALIECYDAEKDLPITGLFIDRSIAGLNRFYQMGEWDDNFAFAYLTKSVDCLSLYGIVSPISDYGLLDGAIPLPYEFRDELLYLSNVYSLMTSHPSSRVREKHTNTWNMYQRKYGKSLDFILASNFNPSTIAPGYNWAELDDRDS